MADPLIQCVERYLTAVHDVRASGAGVKERSYYPALSALLNGIGGLLKPRVLCISDLADAGADHPDFGLFTQPQLQKGEPKPGQTPERGVIEVKGPGEPVLAVADSAQVSKYWRRYRLVIVTNLREFLIIGEAGERPLRLEGFALADSEPGFWDLAATPRRSAAAKGEAFGEFLRRALTQQATLREPKDVAWFLASYARDALHRVEAAGGLPALLSVRRSLEDALGVAFEAEKGDRFFRSTLVQTLFYGVFSAWVLWARQPPPKKAFEWRTAAWHLHVPLIRALFSQLTDPGKLQPLGLVEVLDWTDQALARIDAAAFFDRFRDAEAVQYFYEPFLEAFDPDLRKDLGVWYTPVEVVEYMVARVDRALREDLGLADGLADDRVYVLDPCCGTGAYLAAVLKRIHATLADRGLGALAAQRVKAAACARVFGFEIVPAPFVVAHLQVGLLLQALGAPLQADDRAGIYLTNALTGWEPVTAKPLPFVEFEEERQHANEVKRDKPILVILGNPPYNGFAGMAPVESEERTLTDAYRRAKKVRAPEGQGLNDLYVRFFRMAERRIAEKTGQGVVCFISNYSWLDGLSFTGMRERYLEVFDAIRIDCLNGDKYKTGKLTPEGRPDPSVFSTEHNREGIQVGTAIATLLRRADHVAAETVGFRHLWGATKREVLRDTAETAPSALYEPHTPHADLGLPFVRATVEAGYFSWPSLPELMPVSFPGVKTSRDEFLVAIDRDELERRLAFYFDPAVSHEEVRGRYPAVMNRSARFEPEKTRDHLRRRGLLKDNIIRYAYRPFDIRWLYWEPETKLLDEKREEYFLQAFLGNKFLSAGQRNRKEYYYQPQFLRQLADHHMVESNVALFPMKLRPLSSGKNAEMIKNLTPMSARFLTDIGGEGHFYFFSSLMVLHSMDYLTENAGALRMDWPRIPIPADPAVLAASAALGRHLADLLDPETPVAGVTAGAIRPDLVRLAVFDKAGREPVTAEDFALTAGWGFATTNKKTGSTLVMPAGGRAEERAYRSEEREALAAGAAALGLAEDQVFTLLGSTTFDIWLNADCRWTNVPAQVWRYTLGGYQVVKKWLSYRERAVLGRALKTDEVEYVTHVCRRIAAILLLGPALDAGYAAGKAAAVDWTTIRGG